MSGLGRALPGGAGMDRRAQPRPGPAGHRPAPCESYRLQVGGRAPLASQLGTYVTSGQNSDAGVPGEQGSRKPEGHRPALGSRHLVSSPKANIQTSKREDRQSEDGASCPPSRPTEQTPQKRLPLLRFSSCHYRQEEHSHVRDDFLLSLFPRAQSTYNDLRW